MVTEVNIEDEIIKLKHQLENKAKESGYNFQHPDVITLSQKLDKLITLVMRNQWYQK